MEKQQNLCGKRETLLKRFIAPKKNNIERIEQKKEIRISYVNK
jgi:hypothetical protein